MLLALVVGLALAVRVYGITSYGVWFDEAYHVALVRLPTTADMLGAVLTNPPSDPLYVLILRGWAALFGTGDASVRGLSVIFGTLTVPAAFALGAVLAGRVAGLLGALLVAISPYAVEFSQEAALYALAALLTTLALALGIRWQRTGRGGLAFTAVAVLALYSHYVVAVVLLLFVVGSLLPYFREQSRVLLGRFMLAGGIAFALWLPWLVPLLLSWLAAEVPRTSLPQSVTVNYVLGALGQYTAGTAALLTGNRPLLFGGIGAGSVLLAVTWLKSGNPERRAARLLVLIFVVLFVGPALAAAVSGRWLFVPHFMLFLLPALLALAGAAVVWAARDASGSVLDQTERWAAPASLFGLVVVQAFGLGLFYAHPPHGADGLREMASVLRAQARPGEPVFVTPPALAPSLAQYFDGDIAGLPEDFDLRRIYLPYDGAGWQRRSIERVASTVRPGERFWLVYRPERDEGGGLLSHLRSDYSLATSTPYEFATLYLFEVP